MDTQTAKQLKNVLERLTNEVASIRQLLQDSTVKITPKKNLSKSIKEPIMITDPLTGLEYIEET